MHQINTESTPRRAGAAPVQSGTEIQKRTVLWARDLCERWGVGLTTLWRWRRAGKVPAPDFQTSGWLTATIEAFERGEKEINAGGPRAGQARRHG
jgi:hypothetical protein